MRGAGNRCSNGCTRRRCRPRRRPGSPAPTNGRRSSPGFATCSTSEAERNAGDPGTVLARRLSNAEFDYTIRDLTGVDIRPTREFPVDPANEAGFDNSGESLAMSPALLKKYLAAARLVADHVVLKPEGFVFAPHPAVTDTDRDKYCVQRIIDFYKRHDGRSRRLLPGRLEVSASRRAGPARRGAEHASPTEARLSPKYLALVWSVLTEAESDDGTVGRRSPDVERAAGAHAGLGRRQHGRGCERLRDLVVRLRRQLKPKSSRS